MFFGVCLNSSYRYLVEGHIIALESFLSYSVVTEDES